MDQQLNMQSSRIADDLYHLVNYRELVLEIILDGKKITRVVCELRMCLFVKAVWSSDQRPQCLMPFPSSFFNPVTKEKQFDLLKETIALIPPLQEITEDKQLPRMAWELLHWVFTNPLTIEAITENIPSTVDALKLQTNLTDIPIPRPTSLAEPIFLFKVTPSVPKTSFDEEKAKHGSFFAYHGSPLENFHSIIHRGLKNELNIRKAYGHGTYLSSMLKVSKSYSTRSEAWKHCALKPPVNVSMQLFQIQYLQCIAIVEVVNHPDLKKHSLGGDAAHGNCQYYVVEKDEWLQLSHLIVYVTSHCA